MLTDAERAILTQRLAEADGALHRLLVAGQQTVIRYGDQEYRNTPADRDALKAYVVDLKSQLGLHRRARGRRIAY